MESTTGAESAASLGGAGGLETPPGAGAPPPATLLRVLCLLVAAGLLVPGLLLLSPIWERSEFFSHGYLIPMIAVFLLYRQRRELLRAFREGVPGRFGAWAVLGAASFEVLSVIGDAIFPAGLGVPLVLLAACYAIGGRELLRVTALPIGFLIFMVPPPGVVINTALLNLKFAVTEISVGTLHYFDYPVAAAGNQLMIPGHTLFVADACSGLTSIITLIPLSAIVAYLLSHGFWRRVVIMLSVVPLAMAANAVRVMVTVIAVPAWGDEVAQGLLHETFGVSTYIIGTLALLGIAKILR